MLSGLGGAAYKVFSAINGKADKSSLKIAFDKLDEHGKDISSVKTDTAVLKTKVENIEATLTKMDGKLDRLLTKNGG